MPHTHVHKLIGYGLTDLQSDGKKFTDTRINTDGFVCCSEREDEYHLRHFFTSLVSEQSKWYVEMYAMEMYQPYILDCVHVLPQDGIIAIVPPDKSHLWHRRDDVIDAVIESEFFSRATNNGNIEGNIPPFTNFMNTKTGIVLDQFEVENYRRKYKLLMDDDITAKARKQLTISVNESAKRMGFLNMEDANLMMAPAVPPIVREFVKWLKLFNKKETIFQLRPITLAYWE